MKLINSVGFDVVRRRSREGAWIEIINKLRCGEWYSSRSREGAWIEIQLHTPYVSRSWVAPARERGLK